MESYIKVKASDKRLSKAFDESCLFMVKRYDKVKEGLFMVTLRHKELEKPLKGTYTVGGLYKIFSK